MDIHIVVFFCMVYCLNFFTAIKKYVYQAKPLKKKYVKYIFFASSLQIQWDIWNASGQTLNYFACFIPKSTLPLSVSPFASLRSHEGGKKRGTGAQGCWCTS